MYGLGRLPGVAGVALLAAGLATLAAFVAWALHAPQPVLDITLFRANRVFALSNLAALVHYSATFAVGFLLSLRLQYVDGLTSQAAGMLLAVQPLVQTGISPFAGRLSDRVDSRVVASAGMGLTAVALALLGCLGAATSQAFVLACLTLLGAGLGLFASPNTNAVMASVERHFYGVASAILATMRLVGQMLSIGLAALVLALFVGHEPMVPARHAPFLAALRAAFFGFSVLCAAGTLASLARGQTATAGERQP